MNVDTPEPPAGAIADPEQLRVELAKVLVDFRDGAGDGVEDAIERILEVTGPAWQPIDEAPKDGRRILLAYNFGHERRMRVAEGWWQNGAWARHDDSQVRAKYWKPQLEPPSR